MSPQPPCKRRHCAEPRRCTRCASATSLHSADLLLHHGDDQPRLDHRYDNPRDLAAGLAVTPDPATNGAVMVTFQVLSFFTVLSNILVLVTGFMLARDPKPKRSHLPRHPLRRLNHDHRDGHRLRGHPCSRWHTRSDSTSTSMLDCTTSRRRCSYWLGAVRPTPDLQLQTPRSVADHPRPLGHLHTDPRRNHRLVPVPFLNVEKLGYGTVGINLVVITMAAMLIGPCTSGSARWPLASRPVAMSSPSARMKPQPRSPMTQRSSTFRTRRERYAGTHRPLAASRQQRGGYLPYRCG